MNNSHQKQLDRWDVSRETTKRIDHFIGLLYDWQSKINLISAPQNISMVDFEAMVWQRHVLDSLQLISYMDKKTDVIDIGSGGGFPGLILSMVMDSHIFLVESDKRKCEFLKEAARQIDSHAVIINRRMEELVADEFSNHITITSRACASVLNLIELTKSFHSTARFLLLKGEKAKAELGEAAGRWQMQVTCYPSITNDHAHIISITGIEPCIS